MSNEQQACAHCGKAIYLASGRWFHLPEATPRSCSTSVATGDDPRDMLDEELTAEIKALESRVYTLKAEGAKMWRFRLRGGEHLATNADRAHLAELHKRREAKAAATASSPAAQPEHPFIVLSQDLFDALTTASHELKAAVEIGAANPIYAQALTIIDTMLQHDAHLNASPAAASEGEQETEICPVCKEEVPQDSMYSYNNVPNAFCQGCVDAGRV